MDVILPEFQLKRILEEYLREDVPSFDYGAFAVGNEVKSARLLCKASCIMSGEPIVSFLFTQLLGCKIQFQYKDGQQIIVPEGGRVVVAEIQGPSNKVLQGERVALNLMARTSGITTLAHSTMQHIRQQHPSWKGNVAGTRKTTPGFRFMEKYAMLVGGVDMHRLDLSSMVMLKDNHIWSCGSITSAISKVRSVAGFSLKIEVECRSLAEAQQAIAAGADVIMLDNFDAEGAKSCAQQLRATQAQSIVIEVSGGITKQNVNDYVCDGIDVISMGSLTQGVPHIDFSMKIDQK